MYYVAAIIARIGTFITVCHYFEMIFQGLFRKQKRRIYLDHAAATPVRTEVLEAMEPYFKDRFGNPSAVHAEGAVAREAIEEARTSLAHTLRVRASDVTWTGSGTEANNLAIRGLVETLVFEGKTHSDIEIISTKMEHPSILRTLEALEADGVRVRYADVHTDGRINEQSFRECLSATTALVTFAYANSEVGVVQDANKLSRLAKKFARENETDIVMHLDASQAPLWLPCQLDALGMDMMTLDAGKCGGPKGVGALVHRKSVRLAPIMYGGEQERGLRSGTENVAGIVGCAKAIELAQTNWKPRSERVRRLSVRLTEQLEKEIPSAMLNGSREHRIANNVNISIPGTDTEYAVVALDAAGIAASTRSACSGMGAGESSTVLAMTRDPVRASSTIRFTLGEETNRKDINATMKALIQHLDMMKRRMP